MRRITNILFLSRLACHTGFCWSFQSAMTAHKWMIDLWGGCGIEINCRIFPSPVLSAMRTRKSLSPKNAHVSTDDYNAPFVKRADLPHHRTSSVSMETSRYLICLQGSRIPASQAGSGGNSQVGKNAKTAGPLIARHTEARAPCQFADDDVFRRKGRLSSSAPLRNC